MIKRVFLLLFIGLSLSGKAQVLFADDCFEGGVAATGLNVVGPKAAYGVIKWEDNYTLRKAYAITYRYGRPEVPQHCHLA